MLLDFPRPKTPTGLACAASPEDIKRLPDQQGWHKSRVPMHSLMRRVNRGAWDGPQNGPFLGRLKKSDVKYRGAWAWELCNTTPPLPARALAQLTWLAAVA